ncbi:uncharacterized protein LOC143921437 isoform X2 [Arctopsyche grandis]
MSASDNRLADSFCMDLNGGPASSTPIRSTSIAHRQNCAPSPNAKKKANIPAEVQRIKIFSQPNEENKASKDTTSNTTNKRKICSPHQNIKVQQKKMRTNLISSMSLEKSIFESQIQTLLNNSLSFSDKIVTRKLYKQKSMSNCRKLYSIQSDFTDNDSMKTQDSSFLEKKEVVNIYIPTKTLSDTKSSVMQKNTSNLQKNTSSERKSSTYSLRALNKDEKRDTNKEIMDLLKDIQVVRDISKNSLTNGKDGTKDTDCENFDESDCMFNNTNGANVSLASNTIITKSTEDKIKNKRATSNGEKSVVKKTAKLDKKALTSKTSKIVKEKLPVKRQKNKEVTSKVSKGVKETDIKKRNKKIDVSTSKNLNRKKNITVLDNRKKKVDKSVASKSISSGSSKKTSIDIKKMKVQKSNKSLSVSFKSNEKDGKKRKTQNSNKNTSMSSKSDDMDIRKRKTQKYNVSDKNKYNKKQHNKDICRKKPSKKGSYNKKNDEREDDIKDIDDLTRKYSSKYNHMAIQRVNELDDSTDSDNSSESDRNASVKYSRRPFLEHKYGYTAAANNDRRLVACAKQKIPRFSQSIPRDPYQYNFARRDNFDDFYQRYFPQTENRIVKKEPSFFYRGMSNPGGNYLAHPHMNFRAMTMSFTNDLCQNEIEKQPSSAKDYDVRLYSKTRITIDDHCDDVFKLPIAMPKKQRIIHEKKHTEPTHYTSMRDDISIGNQFMSESRQNFSNKPQPLQQMPHTNSTTNYNKSVCVFTKKSNLNSSVSTIAPQDNFIASQNDVRNLYQTGRYNTMRSDERDRQMYQNDRTSVKPTLSITGRENNENRPLALHKKQYQNYEDLSSYNARDRTAYQNDHTSAQPTLSIGNRENYINQNRHGETLSTIRSDERDQHMFSNDRTSARAMFDNYENRSIVFHQKSHHNYGEPSSSRIPTFDADFTKSPILQKHSNFHERSRLVSDRIVSASFVPNSVISKAAGRSENLPAMDGISALNKNDDSFLPMDNDDDSWITVKRPAMAPCSPWRYSNSYK